MSKMPEAARKIREKVESLIGNTIVRDGIIESGGTVVYLERTDAVAFLIHEDKTGIIKREPYEPD